MIFEWNFLKAQMNLEKHKVSFEEAISVFEDINHMLFYDEEHSGPEEDRYILLGHSKTEKLLIVIHHVVDEETETIKIISARVAEKSERSLYEEKV